MTFDCIVDLRVGELEGFPCSFSLIVSVYIEDRFCSEVQMESQQ